MRLPGHSTREVNDTYTHIELESLRKAIGQLPQLNASKQPNLLQELQKSNGPDVGFFLSLL